jgi:predicted Zn-dependent peptidase
MAGANNKPNIFEFYVLLTENTPADKAIKVIDQEINRLQSQLISAKELERAKNQDLLDLYSAINDNSSVANQIGEYLTLSQNYLRGFEIVEGYKKVTAKNISKAAQKYLKAKNRSIVIIQPEKKAKK